VLSDILLFNIKKIPVLIKLDTYLMTADVFFVRGSIDHATRAIAIRLLQKAGKILEGEG